MHIHAIITDEPTRTLGIIIILVLLVLLAAVHQSLRRGNRIERKIDDVMLALGLGERMAKLDKEYGRRSNYMPLHSDFPRDEEHARETPSWRRKP